MLELHQRLIPSISKTIPHCLRRKNKFNEYTWCIQKICTVSQSQYVSTSALQCRPCIQNRGEFSITSVNFKRHFHSLSQLQTDRTASSNDTLGDSNNIQKLLEESTDPGISYVPEGQQMVFWEQENVHLASMQQSAEDGKERIDPRSKNIILFPGPGAQYIGRCKESLQLPSVQEMFTAASDVLGYDLLDACLHGPAQHLASPPVQLPATLVCSLAAVERLHDERPAVLESCSATAGYGAGEITALTFAGVIAFEDAVRLTAVLGEALSACCSLHLGAVARVYPSAACRLKLCCLAAEEHCRRQGEEQPVCVVAGHLWSGCHVVAGSEQALQFLEQNMTQLKIKRIKRTSAKGAFHTQLMKPAGDVLKEALRTVSLSAPRITVHSCRDGRRYRDTDHVARGLRELPWRPVRWQQTLTALYDRRDGVKFPNTFMCGAAHSLMGVLRLNNDKAAQVAQVVQA